MSPLRFPSSEAVISFIAQMQEISEDLLSRYLAPSPLPRLPLAHSLPPPPSAPPGVSLGCFEPLCINVGMGVMSECARGGATLQLGQACSVRALLLEPPQGGFLLFDLPWY